MVSRRVGPEFYEFRVLIKRNGKTYPPYNYLAQDIDELLDILWKNEGIDGEDCDELIIHQILADGSVLELIDYSKDKDSKKEKGKVYEFPSGKALVPITNDTTHDDEVVIDRLLGILQEVRDGSTPGTPPEKEKDKPKIYIGGFDYWSEPAQSIEENDE